MKESNTFSKKRILIVDDNLIVAETLKSGLEILNKNLQISILQSAEETLLELKKTSFDLIISDIILPGKSGFELLEIIKKKSPQTKVIIVSGSGDKSIKKQLAKTGADAFFYKPVDMAEFLDAVERSLGFIGTLLRPELQLELDEPVEIDTSGLSRKISILKQKLNAQAVFLLGNAGQTLMFEGKLPDTKFEHIFIPKLYQLLKFWKKIPEELQSSSPLNFQAFRILEYDILSIRFISSYILLVVLPKDQFADFSSIYHSTSNINENLRDIGVTTVLDSSLLEILSLEDDNKKEVMSDDALLAKALESEVNPEDAESFWEGDNLSSISTPEPGTSSLTFDEAKDLGLDFLDD